MLTKAMAVDHAAAGVRVNAIAPGPTATPMLQAVMSPDELRAFGQALPIGRLAEPAGWPPPPCSSPPTTPRTSPVRCSPSTEARPRRSA